MSTGQNINIVRESLLSELTALDGLKGDALKQEIARARAKVELAGEVNAFVANQISAMRLATQTRGVTQDQLDMAMGQIVGLPEAGS